MRYKNLEEMTAIVESFERGTISRKNWRHAEHLTVALHYVSRHDFKTATTKMRAGIFNLLRAFEIDLSHEMPYHETLTVFWLRTVADFFDSKNDCSTIEICNELIEKFDKDYPLRFYSRECLFSDCARFEFVEADIINLTATGLCAAPSPKIA